jgi:cytochrome c-type biogenesis protein
LSCIKRVEKGDHLDSAIDISIWLAFGAGVLSFISPCTLPLYPAYLSYISGVSVQDLKSNKNVKLRSKVVLHTLFFLLGISTIYFALGLSATFMGQFFAEHAKLIRQISAIFIIVMGLFLLGFFKMDWLMKEKRFQFSRKPVGYLGSTLIGIGFAAGWTPCIGPILSVILMLAGNNPSQGMTYMTSYILGFSLPFLLFSVFIGSTHWIVKYSSMIMKVGGGIMIAMGVLLYTNQLSQISSYLLRLFQGTWLGNLG